MSLEVLLQAAQYVDQPGVGVTGRGAGEDSRSSASCLPTTSTATGSLANYSDLRGDSSQMSTDCYYQPHPDRPCSLPHSCSDDGGGTGDGSRYVDGFAGGEQPSSSHRRPPKASSRQTSTSEASWKGRPDKTKRIVMKHNTENRSVHNVLEKNRRAHLKDCFEALKQEVLDGDDEKKASHLAVLKSAVRCIQQLQKEEEKLQIDADRMSKEKAAGQLRLQELKREILSHSPAFDIAGCLRDNNDDADSQMTCTAPGSPPPVHVGRYLSTPQRPLLQLPRPLSPIYDSCTTLPPRRTTPQPFHIPPLSDSLPDISLTPAPRPRKKSGTSERLGSESRQRIPAAKISVERIVFESKTSPPLPPVSTPAFSLSPPMSAASSSREPHFTRSPSNEGSSEPRRHLPIKLRILQDQQEGLFQTSDTELSPQVEEIHRHSHKDSPGSPPNNAANATKHFTYQPAEIPIPAMFSQGGFWSPDGGFAQLPAFYAPTQNGFSSAQMYQMNQFLVPVSAVTGGMMGHLPQGLVMIPTGANGQAMFQYGQLPSIHQLPSIVKRPPS